MTMAATRPIGIHFIRATPFADCDQNAILSLAMVWECDNGFVDFRRWARRGSVVRAMGYCVEAFARSSHPAQSAGKLTSSGLNQRIKNSGGKRGSTYVVLF